MGFLILALSSVSLIIVLRSHAYWSMGGAASAVINKNINDMPVGNLMTIPVHEIDCVLLDLIG